MIRVLKSFIGSEEFSAGLRSYLEKYGYINAQTNELWESMSEVSYDIILSFHSPSFYDNEDHK